MNISQYITSNFDQLPKSSFNDKELVMIKQITNEDWGYGHHNYEGYGVDQGGDLFWCYSSGCSCNGTCGADHAKTAKSFEVEWPEELSGINPNETDFSAMVVGFSDY